MTRDGPGLLLADLLSPDSDFARHKAEAVAAVRPDILLLNNFDFDGDLVAARAFGDWLSRSGVALPFVFALAPNSGMPTGRDVDADGRLDEPEDAQGFGRFSGQGGMLILSRLPIVEAGVIEYSGILWRDVPQSLSGDPEGLAAVQRLSSVGHWSVPVRMADGSMLWLLVWHAGTPAFDDEDDRNGRRNADENLFWAHLLDGAFGGAPQGPFVLTGSANLDPNDGEGSRDAIRRLLSHPRLQDPEPRSAEGAAASALQMGVNQGQAGDPSLDTADWDDERGPGNLRVQYVLPSSDLRVVGAGISWPAPTPGEASTGSRHGIVWADVAR